MNLKETNQKKILLNHPLQKVKRQEILQNTKNEKLVLIIVRTLL